MTWPTFIVLGAPRTGTTALYAALRQHPQIRMSRVKEPNFFAYGELAALPFQGPAVPWMTARVATTRAAYAALLAAPPTTAGALEPIALGEASMTNFMPRACARIHQYAPDAKLIVILRHPVERAYSQFVHARHHGWEPLSDFAAALAAEPNRFAQQWIPPFYYRYFSAYAARLAPYFAAFPRTQIRIYRYEAWRTTPQTVLPDLFAWLGVDPTFTPRVNPRLNAGQLPRPWLQPLLRALRWGKPWLQRVFSQMISPTWRVTVTQPIVQRTLAPPPALAPALRRQLMAAYRPALEQLQSLLDQDFSDWLAAP